MNVENSCVFCKFSKDETVKTLEDNFFFSMLDSFPVTPGHSLIIPKRHILSVLDLTQEEWVDLQVFNSKVIKLIENSDLKATYIEMLQHMSPDRPVNFLNEAIGNPRINTKPDAYNFGINDGREAGRTVDHLHWHIIPRYKGDMEDPTGGVRHVIPEKGNYKISR